MDDSFRTFLQSSKGQVKAAPKVVTENKSPVIVDPRVKVLQEKVSYFCKKYGEIGADALDDFFKESVEKFSGFKSIKPEASAVSETVVEKIPMNPLERANAILIGEEKPRPNGGGGSSKGEDIMARAMAIMG